MCHKKTKNKKNQNKGYNQNQQANGNFDQDVISEKYANNSNAQE